MKGRYLGLGLLALICAALVSCGIWMRQRPAAPMAAVQGQVTASLSALPDALEKGTLLAASGNPLIALDSDGSGAVYEVIRNDYRRWPLPEEKSIPKLIAPAPDGGYWMVLGETRFVKVSAQGTVLVQQTLEWENAGDMVCDSVGRVYIVVGNGTEVLRFSPEGVLQGTVDLQADLETVTLTVQKERVFAAYYPLRQKDPQRVEYAEITEDLRLGKRFCGCVPMGSAKEVYGLGSFLPDYVLMEYDDVGLYACREEGVWETVCLWEELYLDGTIRGRMAADAQGRGDVLYENNGSAYVLTLSAAKSKKNP